MQRPRDLIFWDLMSGFTASVLHRWIHVVSSPLGRRWLMLARVALFLGLAWTCSLLGCDSHIPECRRYSNLDILDQACLGQ